MNVKQVVTGAVIAMLGVIMAGLVMKNLRGSVALLADASDGFDT